MVSLPLVGCFWLHDANLRTWKWQNLRKAVPGPGQTRYRSQSLPPPKWMEDMQLVVESGINDISSLVLCSFGTSLKLAISCYSLMMHLDPEMAPARLHPAEKGLFHIHLFRLRLCNHFGSLFLEKPQIHMCRKVLLKGFDWKISLFARWGIRSVKDVPRIIS